MKLRSNGQKWVFLTIHFLRINWSELHISIQKVYSRFVAKQQLVNWDANNKQWFKTFQGKKYYLGTGRGKSDRESKKAAIQRMEEIKSLVLAGESIEVASQVPTTHKPKKKARKKSTKTRKWTPLLVKSVSRQLVREKMGIAQASNGEDLSFGRVLNLKNRLKHFTDYFGDRKLSTITASDLTKWSQIAAKRVTSGEIAPATLRQDYNCVKQLFRYAYKEDYIDSLPRNLDDLGKQTKTQKKKQAVARRHLFFTKKEIQQLWDACSKDSLDSKWRDRGDTEQELLQLCIALGLNTGMTQQDMSDLVVADVMIKKRPPRIIRLRSKTGIESNHLLWVKVREALKPRLEGKKPMDKVLRRKDGRPLVVTSVDDRGRPTGARSDIIGGAFTRLVKRVLGKDDPRRFRELRRTGAEMCRNRMPGTEDLYLSHAEGKMSKQYTTRAGPQKIFDTMLTYLEVDMGFEKTLMKLPKRSGD